jgi:hypothetical protein
MMAMPSDRTRASQPRAMRLATFPRGRFF